MYAPGVEVHHDFMRASRPPASALARSSRGFDHSLCAFIVPIKFDSAAIGRTPTSQRIREYDCSPGLSFGSKTFQ